MTLKLLDFYLAVDLNLFAKLARLKRMQILFKSGDLVQLPSVGRFIIMILWLQQLPVFIYFSKTEITFSK